MAVFEKKKESKILIDDTMTLTFEIIGIESLKDHVEYVLKVCRIPETEGHWIVKHRYSDFRLLHSLLKTPTVKLPILPPKKYFGNQNKDFLNERKNLLQEYLDNVLKIPFIAGSPHIKKFLDPYSSTGKFLEEAQEHLMESLRAGGRHTVTQSIPSMGTRLRKHHFIGHPLSDPRTAHAFWFAPYGPDRILSIKDTHSVLTMLVQSHHPYIVSPISCIATDTGVCTIRPWFRQGSLRDYIYCVKPQFDSLLKYTNDRKRNMPIGTCAAYGRQILEALNFLHEKGISHGCLHSGNVVIENNVCQLMDLENLIVGLPHPLRPFFLSIKKISSLESIDVYSFGHLLYEMVFNMPLMAESYSFLPEDLNPNCRSVFESILSKEACKNGMPSLASLLNHEFFNEVPLHSHEKPVLKVTPSLKALFENCHKVTLARLKEDQKKVKRQRQKMRGEEFVSMHSKNNPNISKVSKKEESFENASQNTPENGSVTQIENNITPDVGNTTTAVLPSELQQDNNDGLTENSSHNDLLSSITHFNRSNLRRSSQR